MYNIIFYEDRNGKSEVRDFLEELIILSKSDKNARINKNKIFSYIRALEEFGTRMGEPFVKHIEDGIWELRPLKNRIFFFYWKDDAYVLVHHFIKKTKKTPKKELERAKNNIKDWLERVK